MNIKTNFHQYILKIILFTGLFVGLFGCRDKASLSESTALDVVGDYLKANPIYDTTDLEIGEITFKLKKDQDKLQSYKELAGKGYIDFELSKQKKRFLSKDSVYIYEVKLTDKSRPFVFRQNKNEVELESFEYQLGDQENPKIELSGKRSANVVVTLKKIKTAFAVLAEDKNPNSSFITKTFKLKYQKEGGWVVTGVK